MTSPTLASLYLERWKKEKYIPSDRDHWAQAVDSFLNEKRLQKEQMELCLHHRPSPQDPLSHYLYLRDLFVLILMVHPHEETHRDFFLQAYKQGLQSSHSSHFQLTEAIRCLIHHFLNLEIDHEHPITLPSGAAMIDSKGFHSTFRTPSPRLCTELASLWALIAFVKKDSVYFNESLNLCKWHDKLLTKEKLPFAEVWEKENFSSESVFMSYALMYQSIRGLFQIDHWESTERNIIGSHSYSQIPPFYLMTSYWIQQQTERCSFSYFLEKNFSSADPFSGVLAYQGKDLEGLFTVSGSYSSLGTLRKDGINVLSMGPQSFPLSESRGFGIFNPCRGGAFSTQMYSSGDESSLSGWVPLSFDSSWLRYGVRGNQNGCSLQIELDPTALKTAFAFYVKAKNCRLNEETFSPGSLNRYIGMAKPLVFESERGAQLKLLSSAFQKMYLIPLSGEKGFWGADFLAAYEIEPAESYSIEIS